MLYTYDAAPRGLAHIVNRESGWLRTDAANSCPGHSDSLGVVIKVARLFCNQQEIEATFLLLSGKHAPMSGSPTIGLIAVISPPSSPPLDPALVAVGTGPAVPAIPT